MVLRGRLQKGTLVAWQGNRMACVNQTRPHYVNQTRPQYVNQMGRTQSNDLAERQGNGMVCVNPPSDCAECVDYYFVFGRSRRQIWFLQPAIRWVFRAIL
jgi:hypothetical protein